MKLLWIFKVKMLKIRAHHLLCIPRYYSGGYDKRFAKNMKKICLFIRRNPSTNIKITTKCDVLCAKCLHRKGNICIQTPKMQKWVLSHDKKILNYLKLKENSICLAKDVFNISIQEVNDKTIKFVCKSCIFLDNCVKVGINNSFRKELNK